MLGHFFAAGQVMYFNLRQAEGINTLDPKMHVCSLGRRASQLWVTFSYAAGVFNLGQRHSWEHKPLLTYLLGILCNSDILL